MTILMMTTTRMIFLDENIGTKYTETVIMKNIEEAAQKTAA